MRLRQRVPFGTILRYLLAVVAFAWVLTIANWQEILSLLGEMSSIAIIAVLAVSVLGIVPRIWMWMFLLNHFDRAKFYDVLQADFVVKFVNTLFPSRFSGRSIAPLALRHYTGIAWADATAVTGVHTGLYAVCYALACIAGIAILASRLSFAILSLILLSTAVYVVVGFLVFFGGSRLGQLRSFLKRLAQGANSVPVVGDRVASLVSGMPDAIADSATGFQTLLTDRRAVLGYGLSWVLALAVLPSLRIYILFIELGTTPETPLLLPLYLITAYAVTVLPLTPGGIGVAEVTSTLVFVALGYPSAVVVPAIILDRFLGVYLPALAGWYPASTIDFGNLIADTE